MTTYGFEAEFQTNAMAVIAGLHDRDLAGDRTLHGYHCDCEHCEFGNGYPFRGQTDSSCSGEIISDVMTWQTTTALDAMCQLSEVAIDVDAEPGPNSGFHVHVGVGSRRTSELADVLWQFVRWEHVLARIAGGRWSERREGMNRAVRDLNSYTLSSFGVPRNTAGGIVQWENETSNEDEQHAIKHELLYRHQEQDRHSNLNIAARSHPTWEFRIWNSTRSAWRMEMFCGLSVAFLDRDVVAALGELTPPTRMSRPSTGIDSIALALSDNGFERVADLLEKQAAYLDNRAESAPTVLTAL